MTLIIGYLVLVPFCTLMAASFQSDFLNPDSNWSIDNFISAASNHVFYRLLVTSVGYAGGATISATAIGTGLGWLYARTDVPLKYFGFAGVMIPFMIPGILYAISWILLCSSQIGLYNVASKYLFAHTVFNIYSLSGMIFVDALHNAPLAFLMSVAIFSSMDSTLEEAGYIAGYSQFGVFRKITLKLAMPGIFGAAILIFTRVISGFEVPQLIGTPAHIFVLVSQIYAAIQTFPPDYGQASVLGDVLLMLCIAGLYSSHLATKHSARYATISGKSFKPRTIKLGKWRWPCTVIWVIVFLITSAGPLFVIIWASLLSEYQIPSVSLLQKLSLQNYINVFQFPDITQSLINSLIAAISCGIITMILTTFAAYITIKSQSKWRFALDILAFLPIAMPGIIVGIGVLFWYLILPLPFSLYGTLTILIIAFITTHIPYGMRYMTGGMVQIKSELEEAAVVSGASRIRVFSKIYFPLLVPSFVAGLIYTIITVFREVSTAIFLYTPKSEILSITIYTLWQNGEFPMTAALGVLVVLMVLILFSAMFIFTKKRSDMPAL
ncbi:MAG TPA: iron ABC transporter permease [Acidocella sp.]|nr:iron ABC transporter permease [Acidocella sp.]